MVSYLRYVEWQDLHVPPKARIEGTRSSLPEKLANACAAASSNASDWAVKSAKFDQITGSASDLRCISSLLNNLGTVLAVLL